MILKKSCRVAMGSRQFGEAAYIPSERASKIMRVHIENSSFDELEPEKSWIKGGPGLQTGGTPSGQSGAPWWPGGECFAPFACCLPGLSYILLCMYNITLWSKFFEPCDLATLRVSADPWALNGPRGLVKRPQMMKSIMMTCMRWPCRHLIFPIWIFWMVPLQPTEAEQHILVPQKPRA